MTRKAKSGEAVQFANKYSVGPRKFSPEGAISVKLRDSEEKLFPETGFNGKVYTFLPLPEEVCPLPFPSLALFPP